MNWNHNPQTLNTYTIYEKPKDFPDAFVVRRFELDKPTAEHCAFPTLEAARAAIPLGLVCMQRAPEDEPHIVESWF